MRFSTNNAIEITLLAGKVNVYPMNGGVSKNATRHIQFDVIYVFLIVSADAGRVPGNITIFSTAY